MSVVKPVPKENIGIPALLHVVILIAKVSIVVVKAEQLPDHA
jgi:hypothetical protein